MSEEVKVEAQENVFEVEKSQRTIERDNAMNETKEEEKHIDSEATADAGTEEKTAVKKKSRAQERIEKLAREKRELARELEELKGKTTSESKELDPDDFEDYDSYLDALANNTEPKKKDAPATDSDFQEILDSIEVKFDETRDKYEDFDELVQKQPKDGGPTITMSMVEAINEVENSGEVAYALAKDVNESIRISKLSPIKQVIAIDKLSAKLMEKEEVPTKVKKVTKAPEPINAIGGGEVIQKTLAKAENFADYESMRIKETKRNSW